MTARWRIGFDIGVTGELVTLTAAGRVVEVPLAGGAGFGDPKARARRRLEDDVADGYGSPEAAVTLYGSATEAEAAD